MSKFVIPWTVACQAPLSLGLSWQKYWSGQPFPSPGDLPDPGIELSSPALLAQSLSFELPRKPWVGLGNGWGGGGGSHQMDLAPLEEYVKEKRSTQADHHLGEPPCLLGGPLG